MVTIFKRWVRKLQKTECNIRPTYESDLAFLEHFIKGNVIDTETDLATAERLARCGLVRFGTKVFIDVKGKNVTVKRTLKTTERGRAILRF